MKPLELVVYPPTFRPYLDGFHACRKWDFEQEQVRMHGLAKRLTDAELAAEYWRAKWTGVITEHSLQRPLPDEYRAMIATVERFMGLPHYDDPTETGNKR